VEISVVIPTFNRRKLLEKVLIRIFEQDFPPHAFEVLVAVDGSTDGTLEMLRGLKPPCALKILTQEPSGQSAARNLGLKASTGDLVIFVDDDILCERTFLKEHRAAHEGPNPCVAFGPILVAEESRRNLVTDWLRTCSEYTLSQLSRNQGPWGASDTLGCANTSIPRHILVQAGGFDEQFARSREDFDLFHRLEQSGVRFHYLRTAAVRQVCGKSAQSVVRAEGTWYGKSELALCRKFPALRKSSRLACLNVGPAWKRLFLRVAARLPFPVDGLMRLFYGIAEGLRAVPPVRKLGVLILQARVRAEMLRSAMEAAGSWKAFQSEFCQRLPVLLYHHVGPQRAGTFPELTVTPQQFEREVRWLAEHGYRGFRATDWLAWLGGEKIFSHKPVLIAFDDGYADLADYALPVLQRYGFSATLFVVTRRMSATNAWDEARGSAPHRLMSADQVREWAGEGFEFGAHSRTHRDLRDLSKEDLEREVVGSGEDLEGILGTRAASFAYPFGLHDERVQNCVRKAFRLAFVVGSGLNHLQSDPFLLRRTVVYPGDSLFDLACRVRFGATLSRPYRKGL
jgi:peptidoglycan/xylan/chitin deacetylase (PgdA/CDA1 family)/GT2 family glycosyltransferase